MFLPRAILYDCSRGAFSHVTGLQRRIGNRRVEKRHDEPPAGVWAMRFILGLIVGVGLTVGGAAIHDNMEAGSSKPLVNWTTANELQHTTFDYVKAQFDRVVKWATSS
jgi:hypothetical protein